MGASEGRVGGEAGFEMASGKRRAAAGALGEPDGLSDFTEEGLEPGRAGKSACTGGEGGEVLTGFTLGGLRAGCGRGGGKSDLGDPAGNRRAATYCFGEPAGESDLSDGALGPGRTVKLVVVEGGGADTFLGGEEGVAC